jgi:hypothetical protein
MEPGVRDKHDENFIALGNLYRAVERQFLVPRKPWWKRAIKRFGGMVKDTIGFGLMAAGVVMIWTAIYLIVVAHQPGKEVFALGWLILMTGVFVLGWERRR